MKLLDEDYQLREWVFWILFVLFLLAVGWTDASHPH